MLRTISKDFRANLYAFFLENWQGDEPTPASAEEALKAEGEMFESEYGWRIEQVGRQKAFKEYKDALAGAIFPAWLLGPCVALDTLADLEEANPAEKKALAKKYTEEEAERELTWLLYREMERGARYDA
ncbi:hypothetical protein LOB55_03815 [Lactobacillus delbrueckii subsp. lactis]|uniref:hypothetical protein n=1 Tax=Lactobacillales TaxID=186826 RepID=UPI0001EC3494|nr:MULTISPECIES: hypothetical protein [Lactobacillales]ADQ61241.1 Hypothetical protein LDBND_1206 [Lactobacillus delbrueckii subsp. bulgaricus ND02]MBO3081443.1 hypothetical protein [Lactobacillus delbrueckii subsp. bulgaricus]MCD5438073.1 hypothetical protein [Lactobacillus delbrueckii subsp. lactis]MCD5468627.1 hypothetical protein [Lactobacillus delbrueckii subsp. lactis]MCZ0795590.1 hypothetical protein [Lactobacillus delbrueckii subsp. lactis]